MNYKTKTRQFLTLFTQSPSCREAIQRFIHHSLFEIQLIPLIYEYLKFPLLAPLSFGSVGDDDLQFHDPSGICIHPITGHLWVADFYNIRLSVYQIESKTPVLLRTITCSGYPKCLQISHSGHILVTLLYSNTIARYDPDEQFVGVFGQPEIKFPSGLAINNSLHQIAVTDCMKNCIHVYSMEGVYIRTITTEPTVPGNCCWNENMNLLYVSTLNGIDVIDMNSDLCIGTWKLPNTLPKGLVYKQDTNEVIITDLLDQQVIRINAMDGSPSHIQNIQKTHVVPIDIALHPSDSHNQLFVCDFVNHCIDVMQLS